jgi:uncharacterized membrane protein YfhO
MGMFLNASEAFKMLTDNHLKLADSLNDNSFFRVENILTSSVDINASLIKRFKGVNSYFSLSNSHVALFGDELELNDRITGIAYYGLDSRTMLGALANVKYFITQDNADGVDFLPAGYDNKKLYSITAFDGVKYAIYINKFALPFGYTYSSYIPKRLYRKFSAVQKQQSLMQAVTIEEEIDNSFNRLENIIFRERVFKFPFAESANPKRYMHNNSSIKFSLKRAENSETYIRFHNLIYWGDYYGKVLLDDKIDKKIVISFPKYLGSLQKYYTVNTTYFKKNDIDIKFSFEKGKLSIEDVEMVLLPVGKEYEKEAEALKQDHLKNIKERANGISGEISLKENKILLLSIPYSKGWTAFVNGKKTKLLKANTMFMALPLKAGDYTIDLKYVTPGLKLGMFLILIGSILFGVNLPMIKMRFASIGS